MFLLKNPLTTSAISLMLNMVTEVEKAVSFSFSPLASILSIRPTQVREEISALPKILKKLYPKYFLEIGTGVERRFFFSLG